MSGLVVVAVATTGLVLGALDDPTDVGDRGLTAEQAARVTGPPSSPDPSPPVTSAPGAVVGRRDTAPTPAGPVLAPVRVAVPALGMAADVDPVGVEPDGSMTVPADPDRVGWYRWGAVPGDLEGSTVLAGHVDTAADGPGAFAALLEVSVGQDVVVTLADGSTRTYRVAGVQSVVKAELPVASVFDRAGPPRLTLVTCAGPFQPELRSYRDNLVVTAVPSP